MKIVDLGINELIGEKELKMRLLDIQMLTEKTITLYEKIGALREVRKLSASITLEITSEFGSSIATIYDTNTVNVGIDEMINYMQKKVDSNLHEIRSLANEDILLLDK